jgi:hypothetical protein
MYCNPNSGWSARRTISSRAVELTPKNRTRCACAGGATRPRGHPGQANLLDQQDPELGSNPVDRPAK